MESKTNKKCGHGNSGKLYPGVAVDVADDCKVSSKAVKDYTKELNNNPRNDDE